MHQVKNTDYLLSLSWCVKSRTNGQVDGIDLSKSDKGQIGMATQLGHSVSKTAALLWCRQVLTAEVSIKSGPWKK